ncbi:hypothetical protein KUTeg_011652 [Tegillarca granosa]|uniref:LITAF domain-containing protein n=1 Tax=Tegillarca granosa TaxID=220873 RepID=A0ABQ9EX98_TEGGR|nr:hypothetical protein KUTeg_011652 [Tegillarca granosa]
MLFDAVLNILIDAGFNILFDAGLKILIDSALNILIDAGLNKFINVGLKILIDVVLNIFIDAVLILIDDNLHNNFNSDEFGIQCYLLDQSITKEEVLYVINKLKSVQSPVIDGIVAEILRAVSMFYFAMSYPVQKLPPPAYEENPPASGYGEPVYNPPSNVVVPMPVANVVRFQNSPVRMQCFACNKDIVTTTSYESGMMAWVVCFTLFAVLFTWFICCIPFCIKDLKDVKHSCPNCNQELGRYNRLIRMQCFACQKDIVTATEYESGTMTWIACLALFGIGFFVLVTWFVCCIPFCISSLKDVRHTCPNCKQELGRYNRMNLFKKNQNKEMLKRIFFSNKNDNILEMWIQKVYVYICVFVFAYISEDILFYIVFHEIRKLNYLLFLIILFLIFFKKTYLLNTVMLRSYENTKIINMSVLKKIVSIAIFENQITNILSFSIFNGENSIDKLYFYIFAKESIF